MHYVDKDQTNRKRKTTEKKKKKKRRKKLIYEYHLNQHKFRKEGKVGIVAWDTDQRTHPAAW